MILVKLGGSLITDKTKPRTVRRGTLERLAGEIAAAGPPPMVLGHGSGSFGHEAAARHGIGSGPAESGIAETRREAARLNALVVDALIAAGLPAFPFPPSAFLVAERGKPAVTSVDPLVAALKAGLLPVVYGDVVVDRTWRATICSTEAVFAALTRELKRRRGLAPERALWLGTTDGVYDADGETLPRLTPAVWRRVRAAVGGAQGTDVTGGMELRVKTALALSRQGVRSGIVNGRSRGLLTRALRGETVAGTWVAAARI